MLDLTATRPSAPAAPSSLLPFFAVHSNPLSRSLSNDLLRCRHDRCRCHRLSCLCLLTFLTPHGVGHDRCGCHLQVDLTEALTSNPPFLSPLIHWSLLEITDDLPLSSISLFVLICHIFPKLNSHSVLPLWSSFLTHYIVTDYIYWTQTIPLLTFPWFRA